MRRTPCGTITVPAGDNLTAITHALDQAGYLDSQLRDAPAAEAIGRTIVVELGTEDLASFDCSVDDGGNVATYSLWGSGPTGSPEVILRILAEHGATGTIRCVGDCGDRWRFRLTDNQLYDDPARIVYAGDVDPDGWIVQMQRADDSMLDHVAVVDSEPHALAMLAAWARADYLNLAGEVPGTLDVHADDAAVVQEWTRILSGVTYSIRTVGAA